MANLRKVASYLPKVEAPVPSEDVLTFGRINKTFRRFPSRTLDHTFRRIKTPSLPSLADSEKLSMITFLFELPLFSV